MAEQIQQPESGHGKGVRHAKRLSTKVDLTPMVDLGFLLITFFILTTTWTAAKHLKMILPAGEGPDMPVGKSTVLTLIPLENEKIFYYDGDANDAIKTNAFGLVDKIGVRHLIIQKQKALDASGKFSRNDMKLIIKPTDFAIYKNIVGLLDEVLINDLRHYYFVDLSADEKGWLAAMSLIQ